MLVQTAPPPQFTSMKVLPTLGLAYVLYSHDAVHGHAYAACIRSRLTRCIIPEQWSGCTQA